MQGSARGHLLVALAVLLTLFPPSGAPQPSPTPGELVILDGTPDDVTIAYVGVGRTLPTTEGLDLTKLRVYGEEPDGFFIELYAKNLKGTQAPAGPAWAASGYYIEFQLEGTQISYTTRAVLPVIDPTVPAPKGIQRIGASFCLYGPGLDCVRQRVVGEVDWDASLLRFWYPKASLMGRDPVAGAPPMDAIVVSKGARLSGFVAASGNQAPYASGDRLPNSGRQGPFPFLQAVANERLEVRVSGGNTTNSLGRQYNHEILDVPRLLITPGGPTLLPVVLDNHNGGRRVVKLSAEILDSTKKEAWGLRILNNLSVPGGQERIVNLIVNASPSLEHRDEALVRIRASTPGYPDELGAARVRLVAGVTPDHDRKDLFFHARSSASQCTLLCRGASNWMNTLATDPRANADDASPFGSTEGTFTETYHHNHVRLDTPLGTALVFDTTQRVQAKLAFRSSLPIPGTVKALLRAEEIVLATASTQYTGGTLSLELPLAPSAARVRAGTPLEFEFGIVFPGNNQPGPPHEWIPKETRLTLPLLEDETPRSVTQIPAGPALVTLAVNGSQEQMGNPGKSRAFRLSLLNEGVETDTIQLGLNITSQNWTGTLVPSDRFRLRSGESVVVTLLAHVPKKAPEGERGIFIVNTTSGNDPSARSQVVVSLISTEFDELPDDADNYTDDPDALALAEKPAPKRSPDLGVVVAAAAVLAVAWRRRRAE